MARDVQLLPNAVRRTAETARTGGDGEIRALTGLRIVAAVWVVLHHFEGVVTQAFGEYLRPLHPLMATGWLGVDLFFLLSGFVLTHSYLHRMGATFSLRGSACFLWARIARVWPLYAVLSTAMFGWLLVTGWKFAWPDTDRPVVTVGGFVEQLFLVQMWHRTWSPPSTYLVPGWSLSVELLAYACFPVVVLLLWRLRNAPTLVLGGLAVAVMVPLALYGYVNGLFTCFLPWPLRIAGAFLSGGLTCLFVRRVRGSAVALKWAPAVSVFVIVDLVLIAYWTGAQMTTGRPDRSVVAVVLFPLLIGALALADRGPAAFLSRELLVLGGRISFALYLVHWCFQDVLIWLQAHVAVMAPGSATSTLFQAHMLPASLLASWVLWRYVEEPGRRLLLRHSPVRPVAPRADVRPAEHRGAVLEAAAMLSVPPRPAAAHSDAVPGPRRRSGAVPAVAAASSRSHEELGTARLVGGVRSTAHHGAATGSMGGSHPGGRPQVRAARGDARPSRPESTPAPGRGRV